MSPDSAIAIAWDLLKGAVTAIKRPIRYVMSSKSFAEGLQEEVQNLQNEVQRVNVLVERARNNVRKFHDVFTTWENKSGDALKEVRDLLGSFENATKTCCYGTLPDPKCRYQFSRKAEGKIKVIQELAQKCSGFKELDDISFIDPTPGNVPATNSANRECKDVVQSTTTTASAFSASTSFVLGDDGIFESRAVMIQNIMDALANNINSVVGVYGMGGVGKSTLLVDVERIIKGKKSFDLVAKADVSENPNIKKIQGEIADALGLTEIKNKETTNGRAKLLHERLKDEEKKNKKVLIILDNLWKGLELKSVGIPCGHDNKVIGCKLLLTSRFRNVLQSEMSCDRAFALDGLKEKEAKILFERIVGEKVHNDEFRPLVDEVLHRCAGLPLLLDAMAKQLKLASLPEWRDALKQIEWSTNEGISGVINKVLQLSYDHLESEDAKSLLQLCVAYGVSMPSIENLVRYGYGLGIFQKYSRMEEARDRMSTLIRTLQASSLLLDNEGTDGLKIHDLVHDFVAQSILRSHPLLVLKDKDISTTQLQNERLKSCSALCFPYIDIKELPKELDCPELHIFLLFNNNISLEIPDSFFNSMKKLAVLHLTSVCITRSPTPFQFLENLHTLCLQDCSLEDAAILGKLKGLQVLSCVDSYFLQLPKEIGQLTELRLLDLNHCSSLQKIEPGVLRRLIKLEELYMENSFDNWNPVRQTQPNASLIELNQLTNLCTLHVDIPYPSALPEDLDVNKLTKYKFQIGHVRRKSKDKGTRILDLQWGSDVLQKGCIQSIFSKTDDLFLVEFEFFSARLNGSEQSICALSQQGFPKLKYLMVKYSPSIHHILQRHSPGSFELLESLLLEDLINLTKICSSHISSSRSFSKLKVIQVKCCHKMEVLFPLSLLRGLPQLEEIEVVNCELMCGIVDVDDHGKVELQNLRVMKLYDLTKIKNFFTSGTTLSSSMSKDQVGTQIAFFNGQQVAFPNLENLYIKGMDNIEMIWHDQIPVDSFSKLKLLSVKKCKKLVNVVPSFILGRLLSLESLMVKACDSLEVVFKLQPLNHLDGNSVACSPLKKLKLDKLSKLNCVWDKELYHHIKFQCLRLVTLRRCTRLTSLFSTSIARDLIQLEELEIERCGIVELIEKEGLDELSINVEAIEGPSHELKVASSFPSYFQHMKTLDVSHCHALSNMFTLTMAANLVELTKLRISKCEILTEVISDEGGKEGHAVAFNQLKYMELHKLTRLKCFSSSGYTLMFPLLEDIIVNRCPEMKFFSEGPMEAPKLERVRAGEETEYFWEGSLNTTIQNMFEEMVAFAWTNFMRLSEFPKLIGKWHSELNPITSSWQLGSLVVDKCPSFINAIPSSLMLVLTRMTSLQVRDCELLEEIFNLEGLEAMDCIKVLPWLRYLYLVNLPKLRRLWNRDLQGTMCLDSLWYLSLYKCNNLRHAFAPSMPRCLPNLRQMEIMECDQMEGVIANEEGQGSAMKKITFPDLHVMKLKCLPKLTYFFLGKNHTLECPRLEALSIAHCPEMRSLTGQSWMENDHGTFSLFTPQVQCPKLEQMDLSHMDNLSKIWSDGPQETLTFDNLLKMQVQNCRSLENVFPHWVATSLTRLERLQVESCGIEEIVTGGNETPHSNTTHDLFPKLTSLVLHDMPRLKNFYANLPTLIWPFLKELQVTHCDKVNMLSFVASMSNWAKKDYQRGLLDQEAHSLFKRDFPNLERLLLVYNNIQMIQDENFTEDIFGKLKALTLACFHDEKAVFPLKCLLERFQNLQSLEVFCSSFEDIILDEGLVDNGKHLVLESLSELKLNKLHNLKSVWREGSLVLKILQCIKTFEVWDCPCLTTIFPTVTSFKNLTTLVVKNSSGLIYLATTSMVTNLVHLNYMTIIGCERMKEIVANDGDGEGKVISFKNLDELTLQHLPNLECFSSIPNCIFRFPSLWSIEVEECPKMKTFSKDMPSTPKLYYKSLLRYKWQGTWKKGDDLNITIQKLAA